MSAPQLYDRADLVPKICARLAKGETLASICRDLDLNRRTIGKWREEDEEIRKQFDQARDDGFDAIADECIDIADDNTRDWMTIKRGGQEVEVPDREVVDRSKLRVETRLKLLAKWDPRRYGDKQQLEHQGSIVVQISGDDAKL